MSYSPEHTIEALLNLAANTKPREPYLKSLTKHVGNNAASIAALSGGGQPGFAAPIDLRWALIDQAASGTTYTATPQQVPDSSPADELEKGMFFFFFPNTTNTGAATLNVGSAEGAVALKKYSEGSKVDVDEGDIVAGYPVRVTFDGTHWIADVQTTPLPTATTTQVFTGSGTWTKPAGCRAALVEVQGAGGGGGGSDSSENKSGAGGGGGGYSRKMIDVSSISSATITVGSGGTGGSAGGGNGSAGGSSSWADGANTVTGGGGGGGVSATAAGNSYPGGSAGAASGGDFNIAGQAGGKSSDNERQGGSSFFSSDTFCGTEEGNLTAFDRGGYGGGGAGARRSSDAQGQHGSGGVIIVTEFY